MAVYHLKHSCDKTEKLLHRRTEDLTNQRILETIILSSPAAPTIYITLPEARTMSLGTSISAENTMEPNTKLPF